MKNSDKEFIRGYVCAVCSILDSFGEDVAAKEALRCINFKKINLRIIDVADREILRKWKFIPRKKGQ